MSSGMYSFDKFITPSILTFIYWISICVIVLAGMLLIVAGNVLGPTPLVRASLVIGGLVNMLVGPIVIRIFCEFVMVTFKIYDRLGEIAENTQRRKGLL